MRSRQYKLRYWRKHSIKRRKLLKKLKLCQHCGKFPAQKSRKSCFYCLLRQSERNKISNAKHHSKGRACG